MKNNKNIFDKVLHFLLLGHDTNNTKKKISSHIKVKCNKLEKYTGNLFISVLLLLVFVYLYTLLLDKMVFNTDPCSNTNEINKRQLKRGTISSILISLSFGIINSSVDAFGEVDGATSTALFGLFLGGTIGYIGDIMLGSDNGWRITSKSLKDGFNYGMGSLSTSKFKRYIVSLALDTFISLILFSVAYPILLKTPYFRCFPSIANGFASAIISTLTFQVFVNKSRFMWAYPDINTDPASWIPTPTMFLIVVLAGIIFMKVDTSTTIGTAVGINNPIIKFWLVISLFLLLAWLSLNNEATEIPKYTIKEEIMNKNLVETVSENTELSSKDIIEKNNIGKLYFTIILLIAVLGTMITTKSKYKGIILITSFIICLIISIALFMVNPEYNNVSFPMDGTNNSICIS